MTVSSDKRRRQPGGPKLQNQQHFRLWYLLAALLGFLFLQNLFFEGAAVRELDYNQFERLLDEGRLHDLEVGEEKITGRIEPPLDGDERFTTQRVDADLANKLMEQGVE